MKARTAFRFDIDVLRELAGAKAFARGEDYCRDGYVVILSIEPERVLAQVAGTEDYRTELTGHGRKIGGACSCPAFEDWGFCKHMVAVALTANALGSEVEADGAGALGRIRDHLKTKGVDALVTMIVEIAERDPALFRRLDMAAAVVHGDGKAIEARLRKAIDGATRVARYIDYREAGDWAAGVEAALDAVADLASGERAGVALRLAERAIERIEAAIEEIDDSDGHCGALLERAADIHLAAARTARPDPGALAGNLFVREMKGGYDTFHGSAEHYADVLGETGLAEYRRLAGAAWAKLPPRAGKVRAGTDFDAGYDRLMHILDFFAERDGDVAARIALRSKDLSSSWRYLQLAEFCTAQGQDEEALRRAEEGLWLFEDERPDERLVFVTVELLVKAGRKKDAEAQLWRAFKKAPSLALHARLRELGGKTAGLRAIEFVEAGLAKQAASPWHHPADLLIRILMEEKMADAAWAAVGRHGASMGVREALARASEATHPKAAVDVYAERVQQLAGSGGNPAYAQAADLVARMAKLRSAAEQAAYVAAFKEQHGRKRNLMKLLS